MGGEVPYRGVGKTREQGKQEKEEYKKHRCLSIRLGKVLKGTRLGRKKVRAG